MHTIWLLFSIISIFVGACIAGCLQQLYPGHGALIPWYGFVATLGCIIMMIGGAISALCAIVDNPT